MDTRLSTEWASKEQRKIAAARARHAELRDRLLQPNVRLAGRDENVLARQCAEKKERALQEKQQDVEYAQYLRKVNDRITELEMEEKESHREMMNGLKIEWDAVLEGKKNRNSESKQAESKSEEPGNSLPLHDDEDYKKRKAIQQGQQRKWVVEQMNAKQQEKRKEKEEEKKYMAFLTKFEKHCEDLEKEKELQDRAMEIKVAQENNKRATDIAMKKKQEKEELNSLEAKELEIMTKSDFLSENPDVSVSTLSPHRHRPDHFKGMSAGQVEDILMERKRSIEEKKLQRQREKEEDEKWARQQKRIIRFSSERLYQEELEKKEVELEYRKLQQQQIIDKQQRMRQIELEEKTEAFSNTFFGRFGQSHR